MLPLRSGTLAASLDSDPCGSATVVASMQLCKYPSDINYLPSLNTFSPSSYMVDAADLDKLEASRNELHSLLDKPQLNGIPVLVLGNKRDLPGALDETGLIERMCVENLDVILYIYMYILIPLYHLTGIYRAYRTGKSAVIVFRVRKRITST